MKFEPLCIPGAYRIDIEPASDERGFFARSWCAEELGARGLCSTLKQCSISFNAQRGTLRGMHWQAAPCEEIKLVRCTQGAAFDVLLDLRRESPTYCQWTSLEITAKNRRSVYVPAGVAHGFQTLIDATELHYMISEEYRPELARGVRWNDPRFGIGWPEEPRTMSQRDRDYEDYRP